MSDCSTDDMKPKEKPKTCGNCGRAKTYALHCERLDVCVNADDVIYLQGRCWVPKNDTIEQRYQQLEQMIRRMHRYIKKDADYSLSPAKDTAAKYYREEIEALGVSLDD